MAMIETKFDTSLWRKRIKKKIDDREGLRKKTLKEIISRLTSYSKEIPVKSLYIFGSITKENMFNDNSDIDIAIKSITSDITFFKLWLQLEEICAKEIDLLDLDECSFSPLIQEQGIKII